MARDVYGNYVVAMTQDPYTVGSSTGGNLHGIGPPSNDLGSDGELYTDESNGDVYSKSNGSWDIVQGAAGGSGAGGNGSPEGVQVAVPFTTYWDKLNLQLWLKSTGTGNTGWTPY